MGLEITWCSSLELLSTSSANQRVSSALEDYCTHSNLPKTTKSHLSHVPSKTIPPHNF
jgi:hypothetical protein